MKVNTKKEIEAFRTYILERIAYTADNATNLNNVKVDIDSMLYVLGMLDEDLEEGFYIDYGK